MSSDEKKGDTTIERAPSIGSAGHLEPRTFAECVTLGQIAAKSGLFGVKTPEAATMALLTGASLGISPVAALRGITVIQGKATLDATLVAGLVQRHPECEWWRVEESTAERCTIVTKRRGIAAVSLTWTLEDARRAKLTEKDNWKNYPRAMLRARCTTELARMVYGDVFFGVYSPEELDHVDAAPAQRTVVTVVNNATASAPSIADPTLACPPELRAAIEACATVDALRAAWKRVAADTAKGTPERQAAVALIDRRKLELERGPDDSPPTGTDAPSAPQSTDAASDATPAHSDADAIVDAVFESLAIESPTLRDWRAHVAGLTTPQHVAASYAKHESELGDDAPAARSITLARLAEFSSVTNPAEYLESAIVKRARKAA